MSNYYKEGLNYLENKDYANALDRFTKTIENDNKHYEAWNKRGYILEHHGKLKEALQSYINAITINPNFADAYYNKGYVLTSLQNYTEAINAFQKAFEHEHPQCFDALAQQAICWEAMGRLDEAVSIYNDMIEKEPDNEALYCLDKGQVYFRGGHYDLAIECFQNTLEKDSTIDHAIMNIGAAYFQKQNFKKSILFYKKYLEKNPENVSVLFTLGMAQYYTNQFETSIETFEKVLDIEPTNHKAFFHIGQNYESIGEYPTALQWYEATRKMVTRNNVHANALGESPDYHTYDLANYYRAKLYLLHLNSIEEGLEVLTGMWKEIEETSLTFLELAHLLIKSNKLDTASKVLDRLLELEPNHEAAVDLIQKVEKEEI